MPTTVHRLQMAEVNLPGRFNPPAFVDTRVGVYAYLIRTRSLTVLVDTGVGTGNRHVDRTFEPERTALADALAAFGLTPADVDIIVNSHLHFDHCGNNQLSRGAEVFVQAQELEVARTTRHTVREWFDFDGARITPVTGDHSLADGITLLSTPGHTPGHQSVLVEDVDGIGNVLIAAQAAYTVDEYLRGGDPATQAHEGLETQYVQSIVRLKSLRAAAVYFSHDVKDGAQVRPTPSGQQV